MKTTTLFEPAHTIAPRREDLRTGAANLTSPCITQPSGRKASIPNFSETPKPDTLMKPILILALSAITAATFAAESEPLKLGPNLATPAGKPPEANSLHSASASGVMIFTTASSTYPDSVEFVSLKRNGDVLTDAVDAAGKRTEIRNGGIVAIIENPPARPDDKSPVTAGQALKQIEAALQKYPHSRFPEVAQKLEAIAARWRTVRTIAPSVKATPAP